MSSLVPIFWLIVFVVIVAVVLFNTLFVVKQQHAVIIERLGRFQKIVGSGLHAKIPIIDRKAATVSLRTMKNGSWSRRLWCLQELLHASAASGTDA